MDEQLLADVYRETAAGGLAIGLGVSVIQLFIAAYGVWAFFMGSSSQRKRNLPYTMFNIALSTLPALSLALIFHQFLSPRWRSERTLFIAGGWGSTTAADSWLAHVNDTVIFLTIWLGDALMVSRCYTVWADHVWVMVIPGVPYAAMISVTLLYTSNGLYGLYDDQAFLWKAFISLSVTLNVVVAALIAGRLSSDRGRVSTVFGLSLPSNAASSSMFCSVQRTTAIIVESAAPLAVMSLALAIGDELLSATASGDDVFPKLVSNINWRVLYPSLVALSSQMVILRITMGWSWSTRKGLYTSVPMESTQSEVQHREGLEAATKISRV